ncbi:MAG TPA: CBS domain-containing protein [Polyangia bacterium]|nr:CBS domain-containing protein [Polyangia bacterium]
MFDFDVLGIGENDPPRANDVLALGTVHLSARLAEVPRAPALSLAPEVSVGAAIEAMRRSKRGAAIVVRQQRPIGIVTDHDLLAPPDAESDLHEQPLATVMTACREPLRATDTVGAALRRMCATRQWHLPLVCAEGLLVGAIDIADLSMWLRDRMTMLSVDAALGTEWTQAG